MTGPFDSVVVDVAKLRDYCLSESHVRGRHKARVFKSRLGLTVNDSTFLQQILFRAATDQADKLRTTDTDQYGQRYLLDFENPDTAWRSYAPVRLDCSERRKRATFCKLLRALMNGR